MPSNGFHDRSTADNLVFRPDPRSLVHSVQALTTLIPQGLQRWRGGDDTVQRLARVPGGLGINRSPPEFPPVRWCQQVRRAIEHPLVPADVGTKISIHPRITDSLHIHFAWGRLPPILWSCEDALAVIQCAV